MFQRRPIRTAPRSRSLALGGVVAALAVVGGTVVAVNAPTDVGAGDILLAQNETQGAAQEMPLGTAVSLDLEPVVARAAGGTIPEGTTVQVTGLPDGLTQEGWVISGTPTRAGEYDVLVTVSNSGVSRSQKVAITVSEEAGGDTTPSATADPTTESAPSDATDPSTGVEPTLSAVPGDQALGGAAGADEPGAGAGVGDGIESDDDEAGVSPDLCSALGGGQTDASSLAQLLPTAGDEDSASTGLVMVLVNAIVGLLPSVLGEGGILEDLGSAGEMLCTLSPSILGGQGDVPLDEGAGTGTGTGTGTGNGATTTAAADLLTGVQGQGQGAAAALPVAPALLGLLTTGAGSLGE